MMHRGKAVDDGGHRFHEHDAQHYARLLAPQQRLTRQWRAVSPRQYTLLNHQTHTTQSHQMHVESPAPTWCEWHTSCHHAPNDEAHLGQWYASWSRDGDGHH